jgi:hypothetical protein
MKHRCEVCENLGPFSSLRMNYPIENITMFASFKIYKLSLEIQKKYFV